tara:strand:+ start:21 stop:482 length:462 start_codon:yes stop_codon:yes gene_type:complete
MSNYSVLEKHLYKKFSIVFCVHKKYSKKILCYIRNKDWKKTDFICLEDIKIEPLKDKTREFLKNPNLSEENQKHKQIKVFYKDGFKKEEEERKQHLRDMISMVNSELEFQMEDDPDYQPYYEIINEQWQEMYGLPNNFFEEGSSPYLEDYNEI